MYQLTHHGAVLRLHDGATIPADPDNSDWQAYQDWLAEGHAPQPPGPPPVPASVTRRQARQALLLAGKLHQVQPAIDAIPDPVQREMLSIEWEDSQTFERHRPSLVALATALGMSATDIDALFISAQGL